MNDSDVAIRVSDVSKRFVIRKEKSLKERIVNFGRSNLHKEDFYALSDVSFDIEAGTTVGLIGPNGSGKSTLLKTIGGIIQPTTGTVQHRGRLAALLELGAGFHPDLTGRENVYLNASILGISRKETEEHFAEIVEFSGIGQFIDTQVKFYSSGMYVRLAFAVAVHVDPDILIIDEVLAVGDEPFQRKCMDRVRDFKRQGKTIVLVTHALDQVAEFCDRAIVLEAGKIVFDGESSPAIQALRKDFETIRQNAEAADVSGELQESLIKGVVLKSLKDASPVDVIDSGQGLAVEITLAVPEATTDWVVGVGIETSIGQVVFGTNSERLGCERVSISGSTVFRFNLDPLPLGKGQYFVHASYGTLGQGEIMRVTQAAAFSVSEPSENVGVVSSHAQGEVVSTSRH
ncbi:ABC transporter ATP-binding protein [Parafrigoribacterium mesophilum]|uniref:ABC transporter ATP-binding protein n=1 Tax=Parafrigoribacterium mesophilum TaxID=433646 RepID=UPI0031FCAB61